MREKQILLTTSDKSGKLCVVTNANTGSTGEQIEIGEELIGAGDGQSSGGGSWQRICSVLRLDFLSPQIWIFSLHNFFLHLFKFFFHQLGFGVHQYAPSNFEFSVWTNFEFLSNKLDSMSTGAGGDSTRC